MSISRTAVLLATVVLLWTFAGSAQPAREQPVGKSALKAAEAALELSRAERRQIQKSLAAAGFEPGPADGLFGRATRAAIRKWQASRGEAATGYLDADAAKALLAAGTRSGALATERQQTPAGKEYSSAARRLSRLLGREFSPAAVDENGWTDLHFAALVNLPELAEALLSAGMRAGGALKSDNKPFDETLQKTLRAFGHNRFAAAKRVGQTPLHLAARQNAPDVARLLMDHGADVNERDKAGDEDDWTPLHYGASYNAPKVVRLLLARGADINAKDKGGWTPLHIAAGKNGVGVARLLIDRGAEVNARNKDGYTPLHDAAAKNATEAARLLIDRGAGVDAKAKTDMTPLHIAAGHDAHEVVQLLIDRGADVWARSDQGAAPMHYAMWQNARNAAKLLVNRVTDGTRSTPLHVAVRDAVKNNNHEYVKQLLDAGAEVNARTTDGVTPLHNAAAENAVELARLLLDRGAEVNAKDQYGDTPLHYAVRKNAAKTARLLLDRSAEVNARSKNGLIPLHYVEGDEVARLLLERGADVNAMTKEGWTPLILADNPRVAALLRRHGGTGGQGTREERKEQVIQMIAKISRALCRSYHNNDFTHLQRILRKSSRRLLGRVVELEEAYPHLRCDQHIIGYVDLLRVTAENPIRTGMAAQELMHYLVHEAQDKTLLGRVAACKKDFGHSCLNLFEHIEENLKMAAAYSQRTKLLNILKRLLHKNLNKADLKYDREFCQQYLAEPKRCEIFD